MLCSPPPATTLASSCAGSEGFCAPCCRRSSQRSRIHNRPKTGRTLLLHERPKKGPEKKEGCCVNQMRHPSSRSANWLGAQRDKIRVIGSSLFDCAGDTPARFDLDFSIGDRARYMTARTDQQPFTDGEVSFEPAPHIGVFGRGLTIEDTGFSDDYVLAFLQCCLNRPLDDQTVAGRDLAGQRHALSEDQGTSINLVTS